MVIYYLSSESLTVIHFASQISRSHSIAFTYCIMCLIASSWPSNAVKTCQVSAVYFTSYNHCHKGGNSFTSSWFSSIFRLTSGWVYSGDVIDQPLEWSALIYGSWGHLWAGHQFQSKELPIIRSLFACPGLSVRCIFQTPLGLWYLLRSSRTFYSYSCSSTQDCGSE